MTKREFLPEVKLYDVWRTLGVKFSRRALLPQFLTSCRQIWQVHKIIAENVNRPGEFLNSAPIIFYDSISAVLYAANREFFQMPAENQ